MNDNEQKILFLPKPKTVGYLPKPKTSEEIRFIRLREKLRAKKESYIEGVKKSGTVGGAMEYAGIKSRGTLAKYRNADPDFAQRELEAFSEFDGFVEDLAISGLVKHIRVGDLQAIKYYLDRRSQKFKPKGELDNNFNLPEGLKEIQVVFKDYSNDNSSESNLQTIIHPKT